jgi:hypothetical protein
VLKLPIDFFLVVSLCLMYIVFFSSFFLFSDVGVSGKHTKLDLAFIGNKFYKSVYTSFSTK